MTARKAVYLTTAQAAQLAGLTVSGLHSGVHADKKRGNRVDQLYAPRDHWPDQRTPLWDQVQLEAWLANRPRAGSRRTTTRPS